MNKNKNGFISAGIIAIIALSLIILSGGGYEGYKYYQQKKESAKEENKESEVKKELQNIDINKKIDEFKKVFNGKFINSTSSLVIEKENNINISSSSEILKIEQEPIKKAQEQKQVVNPSVVEKLKNIDIETIIPAIVKLKCYFSDDVEPSQIGSGVIVGSREGDDQGKIINDTIATAGHLLINEDFERTKGCDVYISSYGGDRIEKRFYAVPFINYLDNKIVDSDGNDVADGLDYALLQINGFKRDDIPRYSFIPPQDIKNIYEITEKFCQNDRKLKIGEKVYALGYPEIGGETITVTDGILSGFYKFGHKLNVALDGGSSGGAIITEDGCFISVPIVSVIGKSVALNYGIATTLIAKLGFNGESTFALAGRDFKRINDITALTIAIINYFENEKQVPEKLEDLRDSNFIGGYISYPQPVYRYSYRSDKKAFHLGVTLEETLEQFNKYHPKYYDTDDEDFNSQNQSGWINGFNGLDSEVCLPNDKIWYQQNGKWCFDVMFNENDILEVISNKPFINYFANILEIVKKFLGLK